MLKYVPNERISLNSVLQDPLFWDKNQINDLKTHANQHEKENLQFIADQRKAFQQSFNDARN
jgi:hypothetical protein